MLGPIMSFFVVMSCRGVLSQTLINLYIYSLYCDHIHYFYIKLNKIAARCQVGLFQPVGLHTSL